MIEIIKVSKKRDWYYLKGAVHGKIVEADAHAVSVEDRPGHPVDEKIVKALETIYRQENH